MSKTIRIYDAANAVHYFVRGEWESVELEIPDTERMPEIEGAPREAEPVEAPGTSRESPATRRGY
jgi:hypothetical protein